MKIFRKLIRDRIPEIIEQDGKKPLVRVLDEKEYMEALGRKLIEEVQEMRQGEDKKTELADIYEVMDTLITVYGFSKDEILSIQKRKRKERGGFEKRLFLEGVA